MEFQVRTYVDAGRTVLAVAGEVDLHTAPALRAAIGERIESGHRQLVVDLSDVEFLDSTGLGVLVGGLTRAREGGGELALVCTRSPLLKLLHVTGLDEVFAVHPTAAAAIAVPPASRGRLTA